VRSQCGYVPSRAIRIGLAYLSPVKKNLLRKAGYSIVSNRCVLIQVAIIHYDDVRKWGTQHNEHQRERQGSLRRPGSTDDSLRT